MFYENDYTANTDQIDSHLDKVMASRRVNKETIVINEHFGIYQGSKFAPMKWYQGEKSAWWTHFYAEGREIGSTRCVEFDTYEEALDFINGLMAFFQWFGEMVAAPEIEQEAEMTEEEVDQMFWEDQEERMNLCLGQVIYYIDTTDDSERVARLLKFDRSSTCLSDPSDTSDPGCWYPTSSIALVRPGRQDGWEALL